MGCRLELCWPNVVFSKCCKLLDERLNMKAFGNGLFVTLKYF